MTAVCRDEGVWGLRAWKVRCPLRASSLRSHASSSPQVDGQFFYNGVPWELKAREYAADTLHAASAELQAAGNGTRLSVARPLGSAKVADLVAVSAMEAVGVSEVRTKPVPLLFG